MRKLLYLLLFVVGALALGSFLLPRDVQVSRSITIEASADAIFPLINSMQETQKWSPWLALDPDVSLTFEGPQSGVGNKMAWVSQVDTVGSGSQEIVESIENQRVVTALDFGEQGPAQAVFELAPNGPATQVTWLLNIDTGNNPIGRYFGLMMDRWVGPDYERGLSNLKAVVEAQ